MRNNQNADAKQTCLNFNQGKMIRKGTKHCVEHHSLYEQLRSMNTCEHLVLSVSVFQGLA